MPRPLLAVSSAPFGGGLGVRSWVLNAQVAHDYDRADPEVHLAVLACRLGLAGGGVGMLTAVDLRDTVSEEEDGVRVDASVGLTTPTWAADVRDRDDAKAVATAGTVNVVVQVRERLSPAALVNATMTVTEAKAQALWEAGVPGTGTPSDALCVLCPHEGPAHPFGGPRSFWGSRVALAVHRAVVRGARRGEGRGDGR